MARKFNPEININPASLVLVGEITHTLRAMGNPLSTGIDIEAPAGPDNPIVGGPSGWKEIPQSQVGLMTYAAFQEQANRFHMPTGEERGDRHPWNLVGAISLDAIFCPYINVANTGANDDGGPYLPHWTNPSGSTSEPTSKTLNPFDPFNTLIEATEQVGSQVWMESGHNIAMALTYNPYDSGVNGSGGLVGATGKYPNGSGSPVDLYFDKDHWARHRVELDRIRGVGFKAPMVLTGWGYDTDGNPVPASGGAMHPQAAWNMNLWKSGPVDLRWDEGRGVWTGGGGGGITKIALVKMTNLYTPPSFSFEVDRSNSRDQYTRNAPAQLRTSDSTIYDPEYVAYNANANNQNYYEQLDYSCDYPYYEAFIIRETNTSVNDNVFYNIWTEDANDCGHITNQCSGVGHGTNASKRILVENPLRQSFDVGDLAFTVYTGRSKRVNTGNYTGGTGSGAEATITTDSSGNATVNIISAGDGYTYGGFALSSGNCDICGGNITLNFAGGLLSSASISPSGGYNANQTCSLNIFPNDASVSTETLEIHWVLQAEFKSQQVVTHVECDNGILQSCTMKIQTQGYKTCEWCGENTALINS